MQTQPREVINVRHVRARGELKLSETRHRKIFCENTNTTRTVYKLEYSPRAPDYLKPATHYATQDYGYATSLSLFHDECDVTLVRNSSAVFLDGIFKGGVYYEGTFKGGVYYGGTFKGGVYGEFEECHTSYGPRFRRGIFSEPPWTIRRSDGYTFMLYEHEDVIYVSAGCRDFTLGEAYEHWGHGLHWCREETLEILNRLYDVHCVRKKASEL